MTCGTELGKLRFDMAMLVPILLLSCICSSNAFVPLTSSQFGQRVMNTDSVLHKRTVLNMAVASSASLLVKKGKMKEVQILRANMTEAGESHAINQFLKDGTRPFGVGKPVDFFNSTASRFQSISVLPEFSKKAKTGFVLELPPPEILGGVLRDAGSRGIVVVLDKRSGGATVDEFKRFAVEQTRARIMTPSPIPVIW